MYIYMLFYDVWSQTKIKNVNILIIGHLAKWHLKYILKIKTLNYIIAIYSSYM